MKKVVVFLADGFEESEAICPIDVLKRAGADVVIAGVGSDEITSSHGIKVRTDCKIDDIFSYDFSAVFCPGGMPGAVNLAQSWKVNEIIINSYNNGAVVSAICASPAVVLGPLGLLKGKKATCYPGCESYAPDVSFLSSGVVADGNIVTGKSAGFAFDLGLKLVELLFDSATSEKVRASIYYK